MSKYFQLSKDAEKWFADISKYYPTKFDLYYLCLMIGLQNGRKAEPVNTTDLIENFPKEFRPTGNLLIGLLIHSELKEIGVDLNEREQVHKIIGELVNPSSPSKLSDEGMKAMNKYTQGGFDLLSEKFNDKPRTIEIFIRKYSKIMNESSKQII